MKIMTKGLSALSLVAAAVCALPTQVHAGSNPYVGEIQAFGNNFCPRGWAAAEGQLLSVSQNTTLFSLFGTIYGGDGRTTFGLPDLRGRSAIGQGAGPGLSTYRQGQKVGNETITLSAGNLPSHNHKINANNQLAIKAGPGDKYFAASSGVANTPPFIYTTTQPNRTMAADTITNTGQGQPINHRSPALALRWCVALVGIYPSRD